MTCRPAFICDRPSGRTLGFFVAAGLVALALAGCAQQLGGGNTGIVAPAPDFSACSTTRQRFYAASQDAVSSERNRQSLEDVSSMANSDFGRAITNALGSHMGGGGAILSNLASTLRNLSSRANEDTALIRQFAGSFDDLVQCRRQEVSELRRDLRARRLTRAEATERAGEIKAQALADASVARDVNAQLNARALRFQAAVSDVDTRLGAEPTYSPRRAEVAQVKQTVQTNQRALVTQAAAVDSSVRERAFDVISLLLRVEAVQDA